MEFIKCERGLTENTRIDLVDYGNIGMRNDHPTVLRSGIYKNVKRMRTSADKLNNEYGAHRYSVLVRYEEVSK